MLDSIVAYKFIKQLSTPWKDWDAYKLGIIDEKGNVIKKKSQRLSLDDKQAFTTFHILIRNIKKLVEKVPKGLATIAGIAIAAKLLKEHTSKYNISEDVIEIEFKKYLEENLEMEDLMKFDLNETFGKVLNEEKLKKGTYKVVNDDGTNIKKGDTIVIKKDQKVDEYVLGEPLYMVKNSKGKDVYVTPSMLKKVK